MRYQAFISYSHAADGGLAPALPLLVPMLAQGLRAPAGWARPALAGVTAAWGIVVTGLVISEPGQMIAAG